MSDLTGVLQIVSSFYLFIVVYFILNCVFVLSGAIAVGSMNIDESHFQSGLQQGKALIVSIRLFVVFKKKRRKNKK